jgi:hypothetical protein
VQARNELFATPVVRGPLLFQIGRLSQFKGSRCTACRPKPVLRSLLRVNSAVNPCLWGVGDFLEFRPEFECALSAECRVQSYGRLPAQLAGQVQSLSPPQAIPTQCDIRVAELGRVRVRPCAFRHRNAGPIQSRSSECERMLFAESDERTSHDKRQRTP